MSQRNQAVKDPERLVEYGNVHAQYFLGLLYRDGGLLLDTEQTTHWLELAAKQNLPTVQYTISKPFLSDDPAVRDIMQSVRWLQEAAQDGNMYITHRLGKEYLTDKPMQKDGAWAEEHLRYTAAYVHRSQADMGTPGAVDCSGKSAR